MLIYKKFYDNNSKTLIIKQIFFLIKRHDYKLLKKTFYF